MASADAAPARCGDLTRRALTGLAPTVEDLINGLSMRDGVRRNAVGALEEAKQRSP